MEAGKEVVKVKLSSIIPNRFQPRLAFNEEELNELASSIKMYGVLQPLILRPIGDKYEIIAGERRYKASTLAGLTEVPAILVNLDDQTSAELAIIENIQRKDLTPIEEAKSYKKLLDLGNLTQDQLAAKMGKNQSTIANKLRLLNLVPEAQDALLHNSISERHARSLLQLKDNPAKQREVLNKIIEERLTVRDTDELIKNMMNGQQPFNSSQTSISSTIPSENLLNNDMNTISTRNVFENNVGNSNSLFNNVVEPNTDVVNIADISNPNMTVQSTPNFSTPNANPNVQNALNELNLVDTNSNVFNELEPKVEDNLEKTQVIDMEAIREAAKNTNSTNLQQPSNVEDFNSILKPETQSPSNNIIESNTVPSKLENALNFENKFFPSLEDESVNMNFGNNISNPLEQNNDIKPYFESTSASLPNSNLNKIVNQTRELISNMKQAGNKIETQELDLADEYQIIIKIKKDGVNNLNSISNGNPVSWT